MPAKPLKLAKGEPLDHELSTSWKGCGVEEGKGTAEFIDIAVKSDDQISKEDEVQPGDFHFSQGVTDGGIETGGLEGNTGDSFSPPIDRIVDGADVGTGQQQQQLRHLDRIENSCSFRDPLHSGRAATFPVGDSADCRITNGNTVATSTQEAPTKLSEIDWDEVDFSDDDLL